MIAILPRFNKLNSIIRQSSTQTGIMGPYYNKVEKYVTNVYEISVNGYCSTVTENCSYYIIYRCVENDKKKAIKNYAEK